MVSGCRDKRTWQAGTRAEGLSLAAYIMPRILSSGSYYQFIEQLY